LMASQLSFPAATVTWMPAAVNYEGGVQLPSRNMGQRQRTLATPPSRTLLAPPPRDMETMEGRPDAWTCSAIQFNPVTLKVHARQNDMSQCGFGMKFDLHSRNASGASVAENLDCDDTGVLSHTKLGTSSSSGAVGSVTVAIGSATRRGELLARYCHAGTHPVTPKVPPQRARPLNSV
jgi:hypothetical protein